VPETAPTRVPEHTPTRCVCPGSFDPPTLGHLDVVTRAAALFDEVVVAVHVNPAKSSRWSAAERVAALGEALAEALAPADAARVRVEAVEGGLLVDHVRAVGATAVVKGLRTPADVTHEQPMALVNRDLAGVETVLLVADPRWAHVSSSLVRQVHDLGGSVEPYVPPAVLRRLARP